MSQEPHRANFSITDRRPNGRNKSIGNRERFYRRQQGAIHDALGKNLKDLGIKGKQGEAQEPIDVSVPKKDISEPRFHHGKGGVTDTVHPGNTDHYAGDKISRPQEGGGGRGSGGGLGDDDFTFTLDLKTYLEHFFEGRRLPNRQFTDDPDTTQHRMKRDGFSSTGNPATIDYARTARNALARRLALHRPNQEALAAAEMAVKEAEAAENPDALAAAQAALALAQHQRNAIPLFDTGDMRFRHRSPAPLPNDRITLFLIMDDSGSMDQARKERAKYFSFLYCRFLEYLNPGKEVDVVFVRYNERAREYPDEQRFFYDTSTGGTIVRPAIELTGKIIAERYPAGRSNLYGVLLSDGDALNPDDAGTSTALLEKLLPQFRHFVFFHTPGNPTTKTELIGPMTALAKRHPSFMAVQTAVTLLGTTEAFAKTFPRHSESPHTAYRPGMAAFAPTGLAP